jgi:hypothetical protein
MDNENGKNKGKKKWEQPLNPPKPSSVIFFVSGDLVRLIHSNRAMNICSLYNFIQDKEQTMLLTDFKKHRRRAYSVINTLKIFKRSRMQLERWIEKGLVPPPTGAVKGGKRVFRKLSYYSEDDIFTIRENIARIHKGRPRKDGRITTAKDVPTERDLRSLMGDAIMLYTKNKDGKYIPIWQEETW